MTELSEYTKVSITAAPELADVLVAELAGIGFDSFEENEAGLDAYILTTDYQPELLQDLLNKYTEDGASVNFESEVLPKINWNEEWEKNYDPILLADVCYVRASFHAPRPEYPIELLITPKMSFGTGHHATTGLMARYLIQQPPVGIPVLDLGAGTGILALLALKLGAMDATGTDVDEWCMENAEENAAVNGYTQLYKSILGPVAQVRQLLRPDYPLVMANINKNILLAELPHYAELTAPGGRLLMSGFYTEDLPDLIEKAGPLGLEFVSHQQQDRWTAAEFIKN